VVDTAPAVSAPSQAPVVPLWRWMLGGLLPPLIFLSVVALTAFSPPPATGAQAHAQALNAWALGRLFEEPFPDYLLAPGMTAALAFLVNFFFLQRLQRLSWRRAAALLVAAPLVSWLALWVAFVWSLGFIVMLLLVRAGIDFVHPGSVVTTFFGLAIDLGSFFITGATLGGAVSLLQLYFAPPPEGCARITFAAHLWGGVCGGLLISVLLPASPGFMRMALHRSYDARYLLPVLAFVTVPHILLTHRAFRSWPQPAFPDILPARQFFLRLAVLGLVIATPALLNASALF